MNTNDVAILSVLNRLIERFNYEIGDQDGWYTAPLDSIFARDTPATREEVIAALRAMRALVSNTPAHPEGPLKRVHQINCQDYIRCALEDCKRVWQPGWSPLLER